LAAFARDAGLLFVSEEEFAAEVRFASSRDYYDSLMDMAAPLQNLFAKLSASHKQEAEQRIVAGAEAYPRNGTIALPIAVRFVTARKPL
jgi:hypothetical protein